jgi:hypothetical protein
LVCAALLGRAATARAFAEDICYPEGGGTAFDCSPLPAACYPVGSVSPACRAAAVAAFTVEGGTGTLARSMIHADATYLLAQAAGFAQMDAYWIAAYDEVTDYGSFVPHDLEGNVVGGTTYQTVELTGMMRTNTATGGVIFHFVTPYSASGSHPDVNGLYPDPEDPSVEVTLSSLRSWAVEDNGGTGAVPMCLGGITAPNGGNLGSASACYASTAFNASLAAFGTTPIVYPTWYTGLQIVQSPDNSSDFDALVGSEAANARLGVYLHVYADRVSHHVCTDASVISGPTPATSETFEDAMTGPQCVQDLHALRHEWETGVAFNSLAAEDQTTTAALSNVSAELASFAAMRGLAPTTVDVSDLLAAIGASLELQTPQARTAAMTAAACHFGLVPFPGAGTCS